MVKKIWRNGWKSVEDSHMFTSDQQMFFFGGLKMEKQIPESKQEDLGVNMYL